MIFEDPFEADEIKKVILQMQAEKSPGPDGFIGLFYEKCPAIIGNDLVQALQAFHVLKTRRIDLINEANIVLLPKKEEAINILDFRPN
jgi:hypothetical protein